MVIAALVRVSCVCVFVQLLTIYVSQVVTVGLFICSFG